MNYQTESSVEEVLKKLRDQCVKFEVYEHDTGEAPLHEVIYHIHEERLEKILTQTLQAERQKREEVVEAERERIKDTLQDMEVSQADHPQEYVWAVNDTLDRAIRKITQSNHE